MIAETINRAINTTLWNGVDDYPSDVIQYSCVAVDWASHENYESMTLPFLKSLGCESYSFRTFNEFATDAERQMARALWLTWAAMIAEEEGL